MPSGGILRWQGSGRSALLPAPEVQVRYAAHVTIQDWGSVGEIVGAVATMATLLYLTTQIRQNTRTVRVASAAEIVTQQNESSRMLGQSEDITKLYFDGLAGRLLNEVQSRQFEMILGSWIGTH